MRGEQSFKFGFMAFYGFHKVPCREAMLVTEVEDVKEFWSALCGSIVDACWGASKI